MVRKYVVYFKERVICNDAKVWLVFFVVRSISEIITFLSFTEKGEPVGDGEKRAGNQYFSVPGHTPVIFRYVSYTDG